MYIKRKTFSISLAGYKSWKRIKKELGIFRVNILPAIEISYDDTFKSYDDDPFEILIAWLIFEITIFIHYKKKLYKISELPHKMQEKIYNEYLNESGIAANETSFDDFIDYSCTYIGAAYTKKGKFIL